MYDCIIIGTGPAGLSAALNLKTYKKSFVWFGSKNLSDKVQKAEKITNYPGFPELTGQELFSHFTDHIQSAGLDITEKTVTNVMSVGTYYMVLADNEVYEAKTLILAMGVMTAKLLKGEDELLGRGVRSGSKGNLFSNVFRQSDKKRECYDFERLSVGNKGQ